MTDKNEKHEQKTDHEDKPNTVPVEFSFQEALKHLQDLISHQESLLNEMQLATPPDLKAIVAKQIYIKLLRREQEQWRTQGHR